MSEDKNEVYLIGEGRHGKAGTLLTEDDRTLRTWTLQVGQDATGAERPVLVENGRQSSQMMWGHDTTDPKRLMVEDTDTEAGQLIVSNYGSDEAGNLDSLRTDPNRISWKRDYPAYVQVDPVVVPVVEGILWNPGATAAELYEVSFFVVNDDAGAAEITVSIGVDVGAGGGLAVTEYWLRNWIVPYPGDSGWQGPFIIAGDDDVRGASDVVAGIHFRARRVDLGA